MSEGPSHAASFDDNDYARPNQPWQCGWAAEGHACPLGPTKWGLCRSAHECSPYRIGDTWFCARTKARGGPCDAGPLPDGTCCRQNQKCQPVRSIRARRGVLTLTVTAAAIAAAFIILGSPTRQNLVSPGKLTSQHSQAVDRCEDCHAAARGVGGWVQAALDGSAARQQSHQCLQCHSDLGPYAMSPHSQPPEKLGSTGVTNQGTAEIGDHLIAVGEQVEVRRSAKKSIARTLLAPQPLACAACHREHHGTLADLTELTNQQCQVCHVQSFPGFSDGHPELAGYPYERRTRLYFDHLSHFGEHFAAAETTREHQCSDCHQSDAAGRYMLVKEFEATCAPCHANQIHDDTTLGIAGLTLPALDIESLLQSGRTIGEWPRVYPLHVEAGGAISPLQRLLLQSDDNYPAIQNALSGVDLRELADADPRQLEAVESLVWSFKELLYDIVRKGHPEVHRRLAAVLGTHVSQEQVATLAYSYPLDRTMEMQQAWLPSLLLEVEARRGGAELPEPVAAAVPDAESLVQSERRQSEMLASGWYVHGSSMSLRYRPNGHGDPLLKTLLDVGALGLTNDSLAAPTRSTLHELFEQAASPFAAGRCMKCHTVDRQGNSLASINWRAYHAPLDRQAFTKFSHTPHVRLMSDDACVKCHPFSETAPAANSLLRPEFIDNHWRPATDPHNFASDFAPMSRSGCAECHRDNSGRDRCLTCHNYHINDPR